MRYIKYKNIRSLWTGLLALTALLAFVIIPAKTASAHYVYQSGNLFQSSWECVWGYSEISHGNGNGYSLSKLRSQQDGPNGTDCAGTFYRPAGYLRVRQYFMVQAAPGWGWCRDTGDIYNTYNTAWLDVARTHSSKCINGAWHQTRSNIHMLNDYWKGGTLDSGTHWL